MFEAWYILDRTSLAWHNYMSRSSSRHCFSWVKAWVACLSNRITEYCIDNSLLSSIHVRLCDCAFNLLAGESGKPIILENAIHIVIWPNIWAAFSMDFVQALNLFLCHQRFLWMIMLFVVSGILWTHVETCLPYSGVLLMGWVLSMFLSCYLFLFQTHFIVPYCQVV